ncbi:HAMP domain-containing protein [Balneolaceae bacterium YR4-1]|uniref:Signal transduction histidine-protein kinase/phosphatase MprB n=1 Tax=Halalkalibaculum roseum TaxID=2709311 RepID=A0A6M1SYG6_9BACT|nr:ATP-binding protein [Halalkalibaculum roseum]NGP78130.1 HAMP domain-containing protein [Halalkalibaculum roseum]
MNYQSEPTHKHPYRTLGWTLLFLLIAGLGLEGWRYSIKPVSQINSEFISESIDNAVNLFNERQSTFYEESRELSVIVERQLRQGATRSNIYSTLSSYTSFWGASLTRNDSSFVWSNFSLDAIPTVRNRQSPSLSVRKQNNVTFWLYETSIRLNSENEPPMIYRLYTTSRIEQTNALPIGQSSEYHLLESVSNVLYYPVSFNFFNEPPENAIQQQALVNINQDSIGTAFALPGQLENAHSNWLDDTKFWRSIFAAFSLLCIGIVLFFWLDIFTSWKSLLLQLAIVISGWLICFYLSIPQRWISDLFGTGVSSELLETYRTLGSFARDGLFIFLGAFAISRNLNKERIHLESFWYPTTILISLIVGIINVLAILGAFYISYIVSDNSNLLLMSLQIIPPAATLFYYLFLGLMLFSTGLFLTALNRFFIRSGRDQRKLIATLITTGFLIALLVAQLYIPEVIQFNWAFVFSIIYFAAILLTAYAYINNPSLMDQLSTLRAIVVAAFILALIGTTITYNSSLEKQDMSLQERAMAFTQDEDTEVRDLTANILSELEQELNEITTEDLNNRVPFIQSEFTGTIEELIVEDRQRYSIDLQLVKPDGNLIADYSTDLSSPNWVQVFDIPRLSGVALDIEQITRNNNRPIVQLPELINKQDYSTFSRGWIPLFGEEEQNVTSDEDEEDDPIAWILCSVYKERPNFNKPIRAVMAALTYNDWSNSYLMQEYLKGKLVNSFKQGVTGSFPKYNRLRGPEQRQLETDSLFYYTSEQLQRTYRNLVWRVAPDRVLKVSTIKPDYKNVLFSFFRLNFTLLISACFIALILHATGIHSFTLHGKDERFRNRILDNFLLATLIFLLLLVVTTHYAIKYQNEEIVRQELFDKLESLTQSTQNNFAALPTANKNLPFSLDSLVNPLNVDASYYKNRTLTTSTTPQIYQQHLLPNTIPFPVYRDLYDEQLREGLTRVSLAQQDLLIGFRSVLSAENRPVAAVAIPTFLQSPKYDQQLLETTSYLIILYLVIFGLFIGGTALVSRRLTRPLIYIQRGLNKISEGDLDTKIPVKSNDEIGSLAEAYNEMVSRLKDLQEELAAAEREAAWKEMAQQVAHEIKNPLTPIKLNVQHLERQLASEDADVNELKPRIKEITKNIITQIQSLNNIASDFSKFSQPINQEFESVSLNSLVESVKDLYQHDEETSIVTELPPHNLIVEGVNDELRRVIINMVKNAFEAMPEGGIIKIRCYTQRQSAFIEIEDNGQGISEEDKSKIFVPNFSTKSSGTGLGLAICKKIIEVHRGSISFASIEGKGTTFIIKLPLKKQEVVQQS